MASNRAKNKQCKRNWGVLSRLGGPRVELRDDPLGSMYDVNKFTIIAQTETQEELSMLRSDFVQHMLNEGWIEDNSVASVMILRSSSFDGYISIADYSGGSTYRFKVGVS